MGHDVLRCLLPISDDVETECFKRNRTQMKNRKTFDENNTGCMQTDLLQELDEFLDKTVEHSNLSWLFCSSQNFTQAFVDEFWPILRKKISVSCLKCDNLRSLLVNDQPRA